MTFPPGGEDRERSDDLAPLAGLRVVALEQAVAAPLCSRHLADLGADVVKVEGPDGDFARHYDGVVHGESAYFAWLNRGKRSVVADLGTAGDRMLFERLLDRADVFVHNLGPGSVARLGYSRPVMRARWPRLIECSISGYGPDGPDAQRKGFDLLIQGESGLLAVTGTRDEPAKVGISIADISAGMYALSSILAALHRRDDHGVGASIDIAMLDCLVEWMSVPIEYALHTGRAPARTGRRHATIAPYGPYRANDGEVNLGVQTAAQWQQLCEVVLDRPELATDPRFAGNADRVANRAALDAELESVLGTLPRDEVERRLTAADIPFGRINEVADVIDHPQLRARNRWFDASVRGRSAQASVPPFGLAGFSGIRERVPALGQDTAAIREEVGLDGG